MVQAKATRTVRAVAYTRVSTAMQERDGVSLPTQLEMAREYCQRKGWEFVEYYNDVMSGRRDKRPALMRLEKDADAGRFDVVIVYKVDRLSRSAKKYYELLSLFGRRNIEIASLTQSIDTSNAAGRFNLGALILVAQLEAENTSERVASTMRHLSAHGRWVGGSHVPLGYRYVRGYTTPEGVKVPGHPEIDEERAQVVRLMYEKFLETKSMRGTAAWLNENGHRTGTGKHFNASYMRSLLENPAYAGTLAYGKRQGGRSPGERYRFFTDKENWIVVEGALPAIVDKETWEEAQRVLLELAPMSPKSRSARVNYPWSGLLFCASCEARLIRKKTNTGPQGAYESYMCFSANGGGKAACEHYGRVTERWIDHYVMPALDELLRQANAYERSRPKAKRKRVAIARPDQTAQLAALERRLAAVKHMFEAGDIDVAEYETKKAHIKERMTALAVTPVEDAAPRRPKPDNFLELWPTLTNVDRGTLLRSFIAWCEVAPDRFSIVLRPDTDGNPEWPERLEFAITTNFTRDAKGFLRRGSAPIDKSPALLRF